MERSEVMQAHTCWRMCDAQLVPWESCATTERTYPVGVDDLIDPSRSAIVGVSGFWICQRFCMLSKMRACIAAVTCWRMWSCATTGRCVCRGGHWPSAAGTPKQNTPMQIRNRLGFTNLHRRVVFGGWYRGRPMAAATGWVDYQEIIGLSSFLYVCQ